MATIDSSLVMRASNYPNVLESFYKGKQMRQQSALGDLQVRGAQNALGADQAAQLARGVLNSPDKPRAYQQGLQLMQTMGQDISNLPPTWEGGGDMLTQVVAMPDAERSQFERLLSQVPENERMDFIRGKLGGGKGEFAQISAEDAAAMGLPAGKAFQRGPDGKIYEIGGGGVTVNTGDILSGGQPSLGPALETAQPAEPDVTPAFGLEGVTKNIINWGTDFVGWGLVWPKADRARRALTSLKTETVMGFKSLVNQRLSNQMITAFEELTAGAGSGKEGALTQFMQTRALLQRAFNNNAEVTANPGNFTAKDVSAAGKDGIALKGLLDRYDALIENFGKGGTTEAPDTGKVVDGYRFKGGDPADPNSWEKVE